MSEPAAAADLSALAEEVLDRCEVIARFSEEPGRITRTFLCEPMHGVHDRLAEWMRSAAMEVRCDPIGNLIGHYPGAAANAPVFLMGSHLDSVPNAGKYDGVLGVLLAVAAVQALGGRRFPFAIEVIGFSEEEGVRFQTSYLGSLAICGRFNPALLERTDAAGVTIAGAVRQFGLDPSQIPCAAYPPGSVLGYLEAHIEQGPVLDALNAPVGVVDAIVGQTRLWVRYDGQAGHAGTLPMEHRFDALAAAAELVLEVENYARSVPGMRATVGSLCVSPGAVNVVPGSARLSLDLRHAQDDLRAQALKTLLDRAGAIASRRRVRFRVDQEEHHGAVPTDRDMSNVLALAVQDAGLPLHHLVSGAGHDASILAGIAPMTMLFVRSPDGVSHHPGERVWPQDVHAALDVMLRFLDRLARAAR